MGKLILHLGHSNGLLNNLDLRNMELAFDGLRAHINFPHVLLLCDLRNVFENLLVNNLLHSDVLFDMLDFRHLRNLSHCPNLQDMDLRLLASNEQY